MKLITKITSIIDRITMYKLVLYGLASISAVALVTSALGILGYQPMSLLISLVTVVITCYVTQRVLQRLFGAASGIDSWLITALILFLILKPVDTASNFAILILASVLAIASKYVLTHFRRHIFNPVAISLVILGLLGSGEVYWWVGSVVLLPIVFAVGLMIVYKIRRFDMVGVFIIATISVYAITRGISAQTPSILWQMIASGPLIFFAAFMLTEPQTSPRTYRLRMAYAAIVGVCFSIPFALPPLFASPELALVIGNLFTLAVTPRQRSVLTYVGFISPAPSIYEFSFTSNIPFIFKPGQYLEWTLPHTHTDIRGDRRYFTIASAPSESTIKLTVRIDDKHSSSFKRALLAMQPGDHIWASQVNGDFTLPTNSSERIVCIAGGVGITPFRSMVAEQINYQQLRPITLLYCAKNAREFSYLELFDKAKSYGVHTELFLTQKTVPEDWSHNVGFITATYIADNIPKHTQAQYYLSGPNGMVQSYKKMLLRSGVPRRHIKTDYFPGF